MKRFLTYTMTAIITLALFASCSDDDGDLNNDDVVYMLPDVKPISLTQEQRVMRDNNNAFAFRLFQTVTEQQESPHSIVLSPISVSYMLGMLNTGADGETRNQITNVLGLGGSVQEINEYCKKMIEEAPYVDPSVTVKIASCIYVNSAMGINLVPQFKADMQQYYHAQIDALDFTQSSSLDKINNWCYANTDGMIPKILDKNDPDAVMYLLNAIYFNATWTEKFDPNDTRTMDFAKPDGTTVKNMMMHRKAIAHYGKNDLCEMLCLPYGSKGYSMFILLPNEGKSLSDVIQNFQINNDDFMHMRAHEVDILMPRFSTSSETRLERILSSMGMPLAFDMNFAEFPFMAENHYLYVAMMKQVAKIDVDEQGTKAAAVTVSKMYDLTNSGPQKYEQVDFHATRPFAYYIVESYSNSIFFMGAYCGD